MEVCGLLADGLSTNEIAATLRLSSHTVRQYVMRAVEKAGVRDRYQLIGWVRERRAAA
jgi:DNA-binding CsgD family transcriptional regulator